MNRIHHQAFVALIAMACVLFPLSARALDLDIAEHNPPTDAITAFTREIQPVRTPEILDIIKKAKGKPAIFMIYASWCPHCRDTMTELMEIKKAKKLDDMQLVFLSVDSNFFSLSGYLLGHGYDDAFTPYLLKRTDLTPPPEQMQKAFGSSFRGGIPYLAFFDKENYLVAEHTGDVSRSALNDYLEATRKP